MIPIGTSLLLILKIDGLDSIWPVTQSIQYSHMTEKASTLSLQLPSIYLSEPAILKRFFSPGINSLTLLANQSIHWKSM